jgi:hypothetical protein
MPMPKPIPNVVSLFDRARKRAPELALDVPTTAAVSPDVAPAGYVVPAGRPKLLLAIGSGHTGKSLLLRWLAERAAQREGAVLATLAPNRTLKHYFPDAIIPEGNSTSSGAQFLEGFLDVVAENGMNAVLDFPGDDTALLHLLDQGLDPIGMLAETGIEVVVLYTLSPRVEDLTAMAQLSAKGFTPKATALILNKGLTSDPTVPPEPEFDQVAEHSAFRAAIERGAATVWMPRLYAAKAIEDRRLLFEQARSGPDLGPSDRSRTHHWLTAMEKAFAGIASWLP